jgi:hypothetical protein
VTFAVLLDVTSWNLVDISVSGYYSSTLKMEALNFYETLVVVYQITRYVPEGL